jgi:hypothetical protein
MNMTDLKHMWPASGSDRIAREERMLAERRAREQHARDCSPPVNALTPPFFADGVVIAPQPTRIDANGQFIVVMVDGRLCCRVCEQGTDERTGAPVDREVLMLFEPNEEGKHDDAPICPVAFDWCEFEYRVRTKDGLAVAVYGLMLFALAWRAAGEAERARRAVDEADAVFGALAGDG